MALPNSDNIDTGISYRASTPNLQKLLDKVKARKRAAGEGTSDRNRMIMNYRAMSARLDQLIEFADIQYPKGVLQSSWRKWKKPFLKRLHPPPGTVRILGPLGKYKKLTPHINDIAEGLSKFRFSKILDELIQFQGDPRPRNNLGEFSPQQEGAPDPNAMVKTYRIAPAQPGMAPNKEGHGLLGLGGLAVGGGAAGGFGGAIGGAAGKAALKKISGAISRFKKK